MAVAHYRGSPGGVDLLEHHGCGVTFDRPGDLVEVGTNDEKGPLDFGHSAKAVLRAYLGVQNGAKQAEARQRDESEQGKGDDDLDQSEAGPYGGGAASGDRTPARVR